MTNNNAFQLGSLNVQCRFDDQLLPAGLACGDVVCASGYVLTGGECVRDDETYAVVMSVKACNISVSLPPASLRHMVTHGLSEVLLVEFNISYHNTSVTVDVSCNGTLAYSIDIITSIVVNAIPVDFSGRLQGAVVRLISSILNTSENDSNVLSVTVSSGNISVAITPVSNTTDMICSKYILVESEFEIINGSLKLVGKEGTFDSGFITLPNNSILLCANMTEVHKSDGWSVTLAYVSIVLSAISLLCLGIRLVLQVFYKPFQNAPGKMQCNLAVALFFSYALLLTGPFATNASNVCSVLGASKYCSYLASFAWMTCIAGDTWWTLRPTNFHPKDPTDSSTWKFALLAWGLPILTAAIVLSLDFIDLPSRYQPSFGGAACWFTEWTACLLYFFIPFAGGKLRTQASLSLLACRCVQPTGTPHTYDLPCETGILV